MTVVFDLDGTTIFKGKVMSEAVAEAIRCLSKKRQVVFASARPIRDMLPVLPEDFHQFDLIGGNGAFTRQNKTIQTTPFSDGQIQLILDLIDKHQLNYMIDSDWNYSYSGDTTHPLYLGIDPNQTAQNVAISELEMIVKTVLFTTNEEIIKELKQADISVYFHGSEQLIDLSPTGISKWSAFDSLQLPTDFIMFGNDTNDLAMFDKATHSFVVGDVVTDVQNATYITQDTVSEAILSLAK